MTTEISNERIHIMKKTGFSKLPLVLMLALILAMSLALTGCACGSDATSDEPSNQPAPEQTTPATQVPSTPTDSDTNIPGSWLGTWNSISEVDPPSIDPSAETAAPGKYTLEIQADGTFSIAEGGTTLYSGALIVDNNPDENWGNATIDGQSVKVRAVATQGVLQIIFNAGNQSIEPNPDFKMITFQS